MPRRRKPELHAAREGAALERRLKVFRQWIAGERDALLFRDMLRERTTSQRWEAHRRRAMARVAAEREERNRLGREARAR